MVDPCIRFFRSLGAALLLLVATSSPAIAQAPPVYFEPATAPAQPDEILLDSPRSGDLPPESWLRQNGYLQVRNVGQATLLAFRPAADRATGEAVIVAPGGGFLTLSMENEGWAVAQALADQGIAAFVLKYRLLPTPGSFDVFSREMQIGRAGGKVSFSPPADTPPEALADARAALRYVRAHAASYGVAPDKVGMMGFSAGGFLTLSAALDLPADERPAFIAPIYPNMAARSVPPNAPPMFVAIASDDFLLSDSAFGLIRSWRDAKRPVEFHLYQAGGHGFGLGTFGSVTSGWFESFLRWRAFNRRCPANAACKP